MIVNYNFMTKLFFKSLSLHINKEERFQKTRFRKNSKNSIIDKEKLELTGIGCPISRYWDILNNHCNCPKVEPFFFFGAVMSLNRQMKWHTV